MREQRRHYRCAENDEGCLHWHHDIHHDETDSPCRGRHCRNRINRVYRAGRMNRMNRRNRRNRRNRLFRGNY
jgi:hypothetical protein